MKAKKIIAIVLAAVVIAAAAVAVVFSVSPKRSKVSTEQSSETVSASDTVTPSTAPKAEEKTETVPRQTTSKREKAEVPKSVKGKYYYLYDDDKLTVYVFEFDENNKVNLVYFSSDNINGLDAEYTKGYSVYSYSKNKVTIKDLPDAFPISSFELEIKDGKVLQGKTELEEMDDLSLDNALRHFV